MHTHAAESVDVEFFEAMPAPAERFCVGAAVLFDDIQFENRPLAEFIELESWLGHASVSNSRWRCVVALILGNWFHSRPSSNRPPVLGKRPPHCLKKNATRAATH